VAHFRVRAGRCHGSLAARRARADPTPCLITTRVVGSLCRAALRRRNRPNMCSESIARGPDADITTRSNKPPAGQSPTTPTAAPPGPPHRTHLPLPTPTTDQSRTTHHAPGTRPGRTPTLPNHLRKSSSRLTCSRDGDGWGDASMIVGFAVRPGRPTLKDASTPHLSDHQCSRLVPFDSECLRRAPDTFS
jgi:hypothetical protein